MPTLQDVAQKAGVSTATVSKVLSNTPYFTEATRKKVMQAVKEVGYVPNLAARALTTGKTQIIGVVFPYIYETIFEDALIMSMLKGIETEAWQRNYNILLCSPRIDDTPDVQFQTLVQSGYFDGMISLDSVQQTSFSEFARDNDVPNIVIGFHESPYFVRCDDQAGTHELMEHLLSLGHRDIGIITVPTATNIGVDKRMQGICQAYENAGFNFEELPIAYGDFSIKSGRIATRQLLENNPTLTAIIGINDRMAIGAIQYLHDIGKHVPNDISVAGFDNIELSNLATPTLTTVDQQPTEQGRIAAQMLFDLLNGNPPQSIVLETTLVLRESTAQPKR